MPVFSKAIMKMMPEESKPKTLFTLSRRLMRYTYSLKVLGRGSNGVVSLVEFRGQPACMKAGNKPEHQEQFHREAELHDLLKGAGGVPEIFAVAVDAPVLIMEFRQGISLHDARRDPSLDTLAFVRVFLGAGRSLMEIHEYSVVHNDFKFENVIVDLRRKNEPRVSIIDLGLATLMGKSMFIKGTQNEFPYMAPEVFSGCVANPSVDVFSFGWSILSVMSRRDELTWPDELKALCNRMMEKMPDLRPSMEEVDRALSDILSLMK